MRRPVLVVLSGGLSRARRVRRVPVVARTHRTAVLAGQVLLLAGTLPALLITVGAPAVAQGPGAQVRAAEMPALRAIDVPAAWKLSTGKGVLVGVLDTGVDAGVPDLTGSVTIGPDFTAGADPPGFQPPQLHGTYIASLIAAHGSGPGQSEGVIGVAPGARVLSVRVILDDNEPGFLVYNENASYYDSIANGIRYAVQHGAGVINMSLGSTFETRSLRQAVGYALSHNVVVVAAAGNSGTAGGGYTPYSFPASYTGVISVAALGTGGSRASFSDRNSSVVVSAPGVSVVGAGPGGAYLIADGTSPASALVAGVAALIRSRYASLSAALVAQAIICSASRRPPGGYSPAVGFGEVDATAALAAAGRLAARRPQTGLAPAAHFGGGLAGPIQVVRRDYGQIEVLAGVAVIGVLGLAFSAAVAFRQVSGHSRRSGRMPAVAPAGLLPAGGQIWSPGPSPSAGPGPAPWPAAPPWPPAVDVPGEVGGVGDERRSGGAVGGDLAENTI